MSAVRRKRSVRRQLRPSSSGFTRRVTKHGPARSLFDGLEDALSESASELAEPLQTRPQDDPDSTGEEAESEQPLVRDTESKFDTSPSTEPTLPARMAPGHVQKALDLIAAIRTLKTLEAEQRSPSNDERQVLQRFPGFGPVALSIFPNPVTEQYTNQRWQALGEELTDLLTPSEYASAKRTTFNAFYTSPAVIQAMHAALRQLGLPNDGVVMEPGCGVGNFMGHAGTQQRFIGIELDELSGRIARALYPNHDIRIESFRDTKLPTGQIDGVIGNVPFADLRMEYNGRRYSLHDYFFAKSVDALRPGGVLALVTSHFTLDKQNGALREYLADQADFMGAIRLPSDAFRHEGTSVVTDIVFLRKRQRGEPAGHVDPDWLHTDPLTVDGADVTVNRYFHNHPEMVLGTWSRKDTLYGEEGFSVTGHGDLAENLGRAVARLPEFRRRASISAEHPQPVESKPVANEFVPPPEQPHIDEGSFYVAASGVIHQLQDGQGIPVVYSGTTLRSDGTMTGRRLGLLIRLRDQARRVLRSQTEAWPEDQRQTERHKLNRLYDRFTAVYGPVNRTTFSQTKTGSIIRRMPNLVRFREDPDAMLVMSLEDYDEVTGVAGRSAIMTQDVVGRHEPITSVRSAEEGLLVSLNQQGRVNLNLISRLYGKAIDEVTTELADLIYRNPATLQWETADEYLSGNVRQKLEVAKEAGPEFVRNVERLQAVQPPDILPGDIDANLGAPWIPLDDVRDFAAELFGVESTSVTLTHLEKDAVWRLVTDYGAESSVAACSDFGTPRANGTRLLELALNMKSPVIYDTVHNGDREERVINQQETMAAREKQKRIKDRFRAWVFADPDRTERLVRIYNDTYNNLRPRLFDGSHLDFPGMSEEISLRRHQKDAVWRGMSSGNTLLAHVVGAGKTYTMAAAGMKMKQAGLIQKPLYVVPNHLLEQFAREFMQLYPNARLLVASKEDLRRDRRKLLTAKIASGEWDGIIVTHSSFERIGMSKQYQQQFLEEQIADYDRLLVEHAANRSQRRNVIKLLEKQKAAYTEKLNTLLAGDKKDDGLVFDELGIDHIFIDEAHTFKNLETPSKMERVAGVQTNGSKRASDLYMKARFLSEAHPGHGVTFATGTPVSNTMVELYTMQRFLEPEGLRSRGIEHFDAWAATFGEVVDAMEISPDGGSMRPRSRFARFTNLPELQQMFRAFSDVQTAKSLDLPRPKLKTGKPIVVACPMSAEQQELQQQLVERYERVRSEKIDPREDNALAITTDGRKLATDARMLIAGAEDSPNSKVNQLVEHVHQIWQDTVDRRGTQLIFADMGVNPTPWGYSPYDEIITKLREQGIPPTEIAVMGDANTDAKKRALFERVRSGDVRILLGSTQKMGTGTNVQKRLVALHHLDAPWKPAEVEQREGRILRQGNRNPEVAIYRYVTEGSFDAYMWQALETKARFIGQVITDENASRRADDVGGQELSYAEVKAIASGNPAVLTLAEADAELRRLAILRKNHTDEQFLARRQVRDLPRSIEGLQQRLHTLKVDQRTAWDHHGAEFHIGNRSFADDEASEILSDRLEVMPNHVVDTRRISLGVYRGLGFSIILRPQGRPDICLEGEMSRARRLSSATPGPAAVINALRRLVESYSTEIDHAEKDISLTDSRLQDYRARLNSPFEHETYAQELTELRNALSGQLTGQVTVKSDDNLNSAQLVARINSLLAGNTTDSTPERNQTRHVAAEESVITRIRKRQDMNGDIEETKTHGQNAPNLAIETANLSMLPADTISGQQRSSFGERVRAEERSLSLFRG